MAQGDGAARGVAALLVIAAAGLYFAWPRIIRWTADETEGDAALWLHANDVAPGDSIDGRVRIDTGLRVAIRGIRVLGAGPPQILGGGGPGWGNTIASHVYDEGKADVDFTLKIPPGHGRQLRRSHDRGRLRGRRDDRPRIVLQ